MCYHVKFGSSASKGVCINRRESQNWGALGPRPLAVGVWLSPLKIRRSPTCVILPNLVVILGQTVWALLRRYTWKIWRLASRLSWSLKVIGTETDRSITYDFSPGVFNVPAEGVPLELGNGAYVSKTRMTGLPGQERSLTISSAVWIQSTKVTDGRTDGHRSTAKTALTHSGAR